ncbi:O-acetyl-ADP-ribose deacetylase macrod1 [Linnemannia schmuckeri]|uniref:O-acetyl-ADP-ribose deacetylase macrod1 n=1 Tax=Linnemannia schmuckeri TaxID=64567 RepID=A0A9P5RPF1_9FUNG|nr:O-acetyl-ADP-ribose deacetylase macrod1 [Linnemannia schmuckeri]
MGKHQKDDDITTLDDIPTLEECYEKYPKPSKGDNVEFAPNALWSKRISMWKGDITTLQIDAVGEALLDRDSTLRMSHFLEEAVSMEPFTEQLEENSWRNAANSEDAQQEFNVALMSNLVLGIIHTVGPIGEIPGRLKSCYNSVLEIVKDESLKSVAFCCISTGIYGYDNRRAADVALKTVREWMDSHPKEAREIERIIFCVFLDKDVQIYETLLPRYFPKDEGQSKSSDAEEETSV